MDNIIHPIRHYLLDNTTGFPNTYQWWTVLSKFWTAVARRFIMLSNFLTSYYTLVALVLSHWGLKNYNPGQNVLGHLRKLGRKTHFAKLTRILPLKKAWRCCYKGLFVLSPSPPSSVDCVELKLECITPTLHRGGRGEGRCLNLTSYYVSVPRVLTKVVDILLIYCAFSAFFWLNEWHI